MDAISKKAHFLSAPSRNIAIGRSASSPATILQQALLVSSQLRKVAKHRNKLPPLRNMSRVPDRVQLKAASEAAHEG